MPVVREMKQESIMMHSQELSKGWGRPRGTGLMPQLCTAH